MSEAWETTLACAKALRAQTILFQCPASFRPTNQNVLNLERFFSAIDRRDLSLCWEPRGNWDAALVKSICSELRLQHVVDPFVSSIVNQDRYYFRLHGKNGWRYQYETGELEELAASVLKLKEGYVFFNNSKMSEDALKFCEVLSAQKALR